MRLGANTWIWTSPFSTEDVSLIHKIAEIGFDIAEVAIEDPSLVDTAILKRTVREAGVSCIVCGAYGPDRDLERHSLNTLVLITRARRWFHRHLSTPN